MKFDALKYSYPSRRSVVYGRRGMVCTSQPLAAQAGLDMIKAGGNAIDAAIATAACMTVLEPTSNGIGGDAFALVWTNGKLHGLNASGKSPMSITAEKVRELGHTKMPDRGWIPVMVPGAPSAWAELSKKFGRLPLTKVLEPAISYAREGVAITPVTAYLWEKAYKQFKEIFKDDCFRGWFETFAPEGKIPGPGGVWKSEGHASTLELIAKTNAEAFYRGELADKIDAFSKETGGFLRKEDLEAYWCEWVDPIHVNYKGYDVWEIPPNGDGIIALMALNILKGFEFNCRDCADTFHKQLEAMKLAFADGKRYVADARYMTVSPADMLSDAYADERRALINDMAQEPEPGKPNSGGTIYLCTADGEGNMVSYIQSNYMGFGSGVVVPGTGISFQDRGASFSLIDGEENCLGPGKKVFHTIIPAFLTKDGEAVGPFGVMGGPMQPQGHVQVVMNTIDFMMNPQEALDAPRWQWTGGKKIHVERSFPYAITEELVRRGHEISVMPENISFGRGQIIWRNEEDVLCGASDPRADGIVAAW
ncbi:MAG: gamma-glutamyltransferase family protein [Lachnospiraceae bacterium]|nr:gamma-glutamyltransferase family protein [Lachnospiraceae bacterium]